MTAATRSLALIVLIAACAEQAAAQSSASAAADEAAQDRAFAATLTAEANKMLGAGEPEGALRKFQRARRWDPESASVQKDIVPLAFRLGRIDEAVRYAQLDAEAASASLLRRLALYLTERGEFEAAARMYRLLLAKTADEPKATDEQRAARLIVRLELGRLELEAGDAAAASEAVEPIQRALLAGPAAGGVADRLKIAVGGGAASLWELIGRCHLEAGRTTLARAAFGAMAEQSRSGGEAAYWLAEAALAAGEPLVAYEQLSACLDADAEALGPAPYRLLERVLTAVHDRDGLRADLTRFAESGAVHAVAALADLNSRTGAASEAETLYRRVLTRAAESEVDAHTIRLAAAWLVGHFAAKGRLIDVEPLLPALEAVLDDPGPVEAAVASAFADEAQANRLLKRFGRWDLSERSAAELRAAAWLARVAGKLSLATTLHRAALTKLGDDAPRHALAWAVDLLLGDQPADAAAAFRWGLEQFLWGDDPTPHIYLATALTLADDHDTALEAARLAVQLDPESADTAARVAWILFNADRLDESAAVYERVLEAFDGDPSPSTRETLKDARMTLSFLRLERGDATRAAELLEQVLDEFQGDPGALNGLAYLWASRGEHPARAEAMARRAVEASPDSSAYLDTLAWAQFQRGDAAAALETVEQALAIDRRAGVDADGEILDHWGDILAALGRDDEAAGAWRLAAERLAEADPEMADEVRRKLPAEDPGE